MQTAADYPASWERLAFTRDDSPYRIRPIREDDGERERAFIAGLSRDSLYARLMSAIREPPPEVVHQWVHVDYQSRMAFVATQGDEERIIGIVRYAAVSGEAAELAAVVADAWQGRGVGTALCRTLFDYARARRIKTLYCLVLANNYRMLKLAHGLGMTIDPVPDDGTGLRASIDL